MKNPDERKNIYMNILLPGPQIYPVPTHLEDCAFALRVQSALPLFGGDGSIPPISLISLISKEESRNHAILV